MHELGQRLSAGSTRIAPEVPSGARRGRFLQGLPGAGISGAMLATGSALLLGAGWAALAALAGFSALFALLRARLPLAYPHPRFGACNTITLWRAAMVLALGAALIGGQAAGTTVAAFASACLLLDGVDGWLARKSGLVSDFGGRFDMEVDAALGLVLALHAMAVAPSWVAIPFLGLARYLFLAGGLAWPWMRAPLPQRFRRKTICVIQLGTLILLQWPGLPDAAAELAARLAALLLLWSFATDLLWLWGRRS